MSHVVVGKCPCSQGWLKQGDECLNIAAAKQYAAIRQSDETASSCSFSRIRIRRQIFYPVQVIRFILKQI